MESKKDTKDNDKNENVLKNKEFLAEEDKEDKRKIIIVLEKA